MNDSKPMWRTHTAHGASPGSIGYADHPDRRLGAVIEDILNDGAADGYVLDRIEQLTPSDGERALVVMRFKEE